MSPGMASVTSNLMLKSFLNKESCPGKVRLLAISMHSSSVGGSYLVKVMVGKLVGLALVLVGLEVGGAMGASVGLVVLLLSAAVSSASLSFVSKIKAPTTPATSMSRANRIPVMMQKVLFFLRGLFSGTSLTDPALTEDLAPLVVSACDSLGDVTVEGESSEE